MAEAARCCEIEVVTVYVRKIIHFFCRPCGEYHLKTHPHYRAMKRRKAKRLKEKTGRSSVGNQ